MLFYDSIDIRINFGITDSNSEIQQTKARVTAFIELLGKR